MPQDEEDHEQSPLLDPRVAELRGRRVSHQLEEASSIISSHLSKEELALGETAIGERLPYNDYTTIDWLHDLVNVPRSTPLIIWLTLSRSKTRIVFARCNQRKGSGIELGRHGTLVKDGLRQQ
jgi:hypothetical protein